MALNERNPIRHSKRKIGTSTAITRAKPKKSYLKFIDLLSLNLKLSERILKFFFIKTKS